MQHPAYYLVIDVEATCADDDSIPRREREIIELGAVMVDAITLDQIDEFQSFVRPVRHPRLTTFCKDLTTIRQIEVDIAPQFPRVMGDFGRWFKPYRGALFCSWGRYDRIQIERDCDYHRIDYPLGRRHLDLKDVFAKRHRLRNPVGMSTAMKKLSMRQQGTHHRGIDDARNLARMLPFILI